MCGIVGILGRHEVAPLILEALQAARVPRLRQRRHRHAARRPDRPPARRGQARSRLGRSLVARPARAAPTGIGHTRWATHGAPNERNAHPHRDAAASRWCTTASSRTSAACEAELERRGRTSSPPRPTPRSSPISVDRELDARRAPAEAVRGDAGAAATAPSRSPPVRGRGRPAVAARQRLAAGDRLRRRRDVRRLATRWRWRPSPTASPISRRATWAVLTRNARRRSSTPPARPVVRETATASPEASMLVDKGNYKHFMAKEIHEQPAVIGDTLRALRRPGPHSRRRCRPGIDFTALRPRCPSSPAAPRYYACLRREILVRGARPAAGRGRRRLGVPLPRAAARRRGASARSSRQSGETADTLAALRYVKAQGSPTLAVVNVPRPPRSPARPTSCCRPSPARRSASPRPRPSPASSRCSPASPIAAGARARPLDAAAEARARRGARPTCPALLVRGAGARAADRRRSPRELARAQDVLFLGRGPCTRWRSKAR